MLSLRQTLATAALLLASLPALAATHSPVGTWKTIDDDTGQAKAIVQLTEHNGVLEGKILQVLKSDDGPHPLCKKCDGKRHNQPIEGMTFVWGLTRDGDEWDGGRILDPKTGKIYKAKMELVDGGQKLKVRGYIGFSLLGRTQIWLRHDMPKPAMTPAPAASPDMHPDATSADQG
ncbi:hypothetical protein GCM10027285_24790 [Oleiagrimonas citrea]|uniref:DUF2147 domain-containing protein n=1 Tax=Oleiagrimonas citrea TaxID=1665687 RepID=A0A846ZLX0_9GAMM|nr:DUF2147 domain-containing protein [Oleiagrimonas citrea]RAP59194.1 hypothetical protein BTJ49_00435 [Oleiagrimonas sp. MCCC 1A03011]